jgi:hypothetical protein
MNFESTPCVLHLQYHLAIHMSSNQDESVRIKSLMETFSKDLKVGYYCASTCRFSDLFRPEQYRARCLREWTGQSSSTHTVQSYIQKLAGELSDDLEEIVIYFTFFNKYGNYSFSTISFSPMSRDRHPLHTIRAKAGFRVRSQYVHYGDFLFSCYSYYTANCTKLPVCGPDLLDC